MVKLVLLRHGESQWNKENRFTGWADIDLTEKGIEEEKRHLRRQIKELEKRYKGYDYYMKCVKRSGIPYELISSVLPKIEEEINNILSQIVEFTIKLTTDGKNINAHVFYDDDNTWSLSLSSGMEKFVSSIAIRSALISITSLPRPSFLVIDE